MQTSPSSLAAQHAATSRAATSWTCALPLDTGTVAWFAFDLSHFAYGGLRGKSYNGPKEGVGAHTTPASRSTGIGSAA